MFAALAAPIFLIVTFLVVRAEQESATQTLVQSTEIQNASLARTMANTYADPISYLLAFDIGDAPELLPIAIRRSGLETIVRASLQDTNISNLKIYDGNGITLFSLDQSQLGEDVSACECFAHVLSGEIMSELIRTSDAHHGAPLTATARGSTTSDHGDHGAANFVTHADADIDILTTMIRISVLAPDIIASDGVLEIQSDVTSLLAAIDGARGDVYLTVGLPLLALYVMMVVIVFFVHAAVLQRQEEAREMASKAAESEAANRAKSEFLSLMSHELRTPLNAIIGFSELIEQNETRNGDSETINYARTIHESGHHMLRQIVSILDMTAIELGELDLHAKPVNLDAVAREAVRNVLPAFERSLVNLEVQDAPPLPMVAGDSAKLREVFENLLSNSARFTPAGGRVDVIFGTEPGGWVCVGIKDTGVGMTGEQIARARLPFQHKWKGLSREADGAGLGLTIADKIVSQLGGELVIESLKDVGTKIIVRLPEITEAGETDDPVSPIVRMAAE